jgi:CSLREA domain-containing protein
MIGMSNVGEEKKIKKFRFRRLPYALLVFCVVSLASKPARAALLTYTVNSTKDHDDGSCTPNDCTLREAIQAANADGQDSLIAFGISGPPPYVITVSTQLPTLLENGTTIDGTTQPGYGPDPAVILAGDPIVDVPVGLAINAADCTVRGLSLIQFSGPWSGIYGAIYISGGGGNLVEKNHIGIARVPAVKQNLVGVTVTSNNQTVRNNVISNNFLAVHVMDRVSLVTIQSNRIGTDRSGTAAVPNIWGIRLERDSSRVLLGGPGKGNLISGNSVGAISAEGSGHIIMGNLIGTDITGMAALPNVEGIDICGEAEGFRIGGTGPGEGNVISGNVDIGLYIGSGRHTVQGNKIGVDAAGANALPNLDGLYLGRCSTGGVTYEAHDVLVGGPMGSGAENIISGNRSYGLVIIGSHNTVQGNFIGTDGSGSAAVPTLYGVGVNITGNDNQIGGAAANLGNVISANTRGVVLLDDDNQIVGNRIGTDRTGSYALGNGTGVQIFADNNSVGTGVSAAGNLISGNEVGVAVEKGSNNRILGNIIGTNAAGTAAVPNQVGVAVGLDYDYQPQDTVIGEPGAGNRIARNDQCGILFSENAFHADIAENEIHHNGGAPGGICSGQGIVLVGTYDDVERITITKNSIYQNGGLGIELIGFLANHPAHPPELEPVENTTLNGFVPCAGCHVEVFLADPDPTGFGEGMTFLTETTTGSDGRFSVSLSGYDSDDYFTATATILQSTSEFSQNVRGPATIHICLLWMEVPILIITGVVGGCVLGRRRKRRVVPLAAVGGLLGAGLGILILLVYSLRTIRTPMFPEAEEGITPLPVCSRFTDEELTGPPDGAEFGAGTDVLIETAPAAAESDPSIRWRLEIAGPDGSSAVREFTGNFSARLSELGFDPSITGVYGWKITGEERDPESGGWIPLCRTRRGRTFIIRTYPTVRDSFFPGTLPSEPGKNDRTGLDGGGPSARTTNNSNCRRGPGTDFSIVTVLPQGGVYPIEGRNPEGTWWWVLLPGGLGHCWVAGENVLVGGDAEGVEVVESPPLGCWVYTGSLVGSPGETVCIAPCPYGAKPGGACEP